MNLLMFYCGLIMIVVTIILMIGKIKTGKALDYGGHFVAAMDSPVYFVIFTVLNFIFLLFISITMIVISMLG